MKTIAAIALLAALTAGCRMPIAVVMGRDVGGPDEDITVVCLSDCEPVCGSLDLGNIVCSEDASAVQTLLR